MIALKDEFITEVKYNEVEVVVGGRPFWLHTRKDTDQVYGEIRDLLGGVCKTEPEAVALPIKRGPGRPKKSNKV